MLILTVKVLNELMVKNFKGGKHKIILTKFDCLLYRQQKYYLCLKNAKCIANTFKSKKEQHLLLS